MKIIKLLTLLIISLIFLSSVYAAPNVNHTASSITSGTFDPGDFTFQGNLEQTRSGEVSHYLTNTQAGGRRYALVSAGSLGGIGVGKFSIYDATAGISRLAIDTAGNVGIGSTTPSYKLYVVGDAGWTGSLLTGSVPWARLTTFPGACPAGQYVTAVGGTLTCSTSGSTGVNGSGTTNYVPKWATASSLGNSIIFDNGNVGIGTTSPLVKLSLGTDVTAKKLAMYDGVNDFYGFGMQPSRLTIYAGNLERMTVMNSGNVGIGTTGPSTKLQVDGTFMVNTATESPAFLTGDTYLYVQPVANSYVRLGVWDSSAGALPLALQQAGGNVGIGTTNPGAKLK